MPSNNFVYSDVHLYVCDPGPTKFSLIYLGSLQIPVARLYKRQHYQFLVVFRIFPLLQIKVSIFHPIDSIQSHSDVHESTVLETLYAPITLLMNSTSLFPIILYSIAVPDSWLNSAFKTVPGSRI